MIDTPLTAALPPLIAVTPAAPAPEVITEPPFRSRAPPVSAWTPGLLFPVVTTTTPTPATGLVVMLEPEPDASRPAESAPCVVTDPPLSVAIPRLDA